MYELARCSILGLKPAPARKEIVEAALRCGLTPQRTEELLHPMTRPLNFEIGLLANNLGISEDEIRLRFNAVDESLRRRLAENASQVTKDLAGRETPEKAFEPPAPSFRTGLGKLYKADCLDFLKSVPSESVDLVFADPPFNLKKIYESGIDDDLTEKAYLAWCEEWLDECSRVLKPGGSLFVWNIPKWCTHLSGFLNGRLTFRHWIAADVKYSLPISKRLYPSHYGLLYYTKGRTPAHFSPDRMPMATCPTCGDELKDYGGYKSKMNPAGINLADVWTDISPVRHSKHKKRKEANELPIKLLDRIIELSTAAGQVVLDPFGGAGTTYAVCEIKGRRWIGCEIGSIEQIVERFTDLSEERARLEKIRSEYNHLFPPKVHALRRKRGLWTPEDFSESTEDKNEQSLF